MKKLGIICKLNRQEPLEILRELLPWLTQKGCEVFVTRDRSTT